MKILCECGATIVDQADQLPNKAHLIADQDWDGIFEAIDQAIENPGTAASAREAACMRVRELILAKARMAWQCFACGRLYLDDHAHVAREFVPAAPETAQGLLRGQSRE